MILGWDSATFDVTGPLMSEGRLPALASLQQRGFTAPLRSTWPPMTDCAWTSAFTGVNPGTHGIFGSWYRAPGAYECRYFSGRDRRSKALWELGSDARFLVWNVPMAYPPSPLEGVMVSGYGAPPGARMCYPDNFQDRLAERFELLDIVDRAPHTSLERFLEDLLRGLEVQAEALTWAAAESGADCVVAVWPHVDRAQHFFWRFRNSSHPLSNAVDRVYEAMDRVTGVLLARWPEADFVVISDHGAGPLHADVNLGKWLADRGRAVYGKKRSSPLLRAAWALPPSARKLGRRFAPDTARKTLGATITGQLGPFDWSKTRAFCGINGDLWLNLEGREPLGMVPEDAAAELEEELAAGLLELRDPGRGTAVVRAVYPRKGIYSGPATHLAPDLMLDMWSEGYRVTPAREPSELVTAPQPLAGVKEAWSSEHRPLGIFVAAGPRFSEGRAEELSLLDVCPTALALLEAAVPAGLDGRAATEAFDVDWLSSHPESSTQAATTRPIEGDYSEEEAAAVAAHLKDLGYIE